MSHEFSGGNHERGQVFHVNLLAEEWTERLADAPIYEKTAVVHIRPAVPGELVVTTLADGSRETENTAGEDQVVVTNPGGEKQIVDLEKAVQRYDLTDTPGLFAAKGMVRAIDNPLGRPISIVAPWGGLQHGDAQCKIAAIYDPSTPDLLSTDRYLIGKDEFTKTYGDQPVRMGTDGAAPPVASALVLESMEAYNAQAEDSQPGNRPHLGTVGVFFAAMLPPPEELPAD